MSNVQFPTLADAFIETPRQRREREAEAGAFEALLNNVAPAPMATARSENIGYFSFTSLSLFSESYSFSGIAEGLLDNIANALNPFSAIAGQAEGFPFTPAFTAIFGTSGPLLDYIRLITAQLNLTPEQNLALQNISIANKDITKTPENIQKISMELQAAGIGMAG